MGLLNVVVGSEDPGKAWTHSSRQPQPDISCNRGLGLQYDPIPGGLQSSSGLKTGQGSRRPLCSFAEGCLVRVSAYSICRVALCLTGARPSTSSNLLGLCGRWPVSRGS